MVGVVALCALCVALLNRPDAGAAGATIVAPDTNGDVGVYTSIVLDASGNPVISYGDSQPLTLKVIHCGNASCASGNAIATLDPYAGVWSSIKLDAAGNPVIAYLESLHTDLKVIHCGNPNCTTGNTITSPDTEGFVGLYASLALDAAGYPVVSYRDEFRFALKILHCGDAACSAGNTITIPDSTWNVGEFTSIALDAAGYPVVSYYSLHDADLKIVHCGDADCSSDNTIVTADSMNTVGWFTSLALDAAGNPVVSYYDQTNGDLKLLHCGNATCTAGNSVTAPDTAGNVGFDTSLALDANGNPVISYRDITNNDLKVLHCSDPTCSMGNFVARPDSAGAVGELTSLVLDATGDPVVSYYDTTHGDLKVLHCADPNCSGDVKAATPTPPQPCGDANGDGRVNSIDATLVLQYDAGRLRQLPHPESADANGDRRINSVDATIILQIGAGLLPECA